MLLSSSLELKEARISNKQKNLYIFRIFMFIFHVKLLRDNTPGLFLDTSENCMGFFWFLSLLLLIFSSTAHSPFTGISLVFFFI